MANQSKFSTQLSYVAEATPGTTPSSPTMILLPTTDPLALQRGRDTFTSSQIYSHRQTEALRAGRDTIGGNIPIELQYNAFDDFLASLLGGTWTAVAPFTLKTGNTIQTFTIQRAYPDIGQYEVMRGVMPSELTLNITPGGIVTGSFNVLGMGWDAMATATIGSGSPTDNSNEPFAGLANATIQEGGSKIAIVTSVSLDINNNAGTNGLVGSSDNAEPMFGEEGITGTLTARLQDASLAGKFEGDTDTSMNIQLSDGTNTMTIDLPKLKYTNANPQANNNAVDISMNFTALYDSSSSTSISITHS